MTILVATDSSPATTALCAEAASWAARLGGETTLLHVVHDPVLAPALTNDVSGDVERARTELRRLAGTLPSGTRVTTEVQTAEDVAAAILAMAGRGGVRFVFLCASNKSLLDRIRLGSIAAKVVRASPVPVVCFPPSPPAGGAPAAGPIVLTTDLSDESRRAFAPTFALARGLGLPVTVFGVVHGVPAEPLAGSPVGVPARPQPLRDSESALAGLVAAAGGEAGTKIVIERGADAATAICDQVRREGARYIAMATHGRSGLRRLLLGSVTEAVLARSPVPVIAFPPPAA